MHAVLQICDRPSAFKTWLKEKVRSTREAAAALAQAAPVPGAAQPEITEPDEEEEASGGFAVVLSGDGLSSVSGKASLGMVSEASGDEGADSADGEPSAQPGAADMPGMGTGAAAPAAEQAEHQAAAEQAAAAVAVPAVGDRIREQPAARRFPQETGVFPAALAEELLAIIEVRRRGKLCTTSARRRWGACRCPHFQPLPAAAGRVAFCRLLRQGSLIPGLPARCGLWSSCCGTVSARARSWSWWRRGACGAAGTVSWEL